MGSSFWAYSSRSPHFSGNGLRWFGFLQPNLVLQASSPSTFNVRKKKKNDHPKSGHGLGRLASQCVSAPLHPVRSLSQCIRVSFVQKLSKRLELFLSPLIFFPLSNNYNSDWLLLSHAYLLLCMQQVLLWTCLKIILRFSILVYQSGFHLWPAAIYI